MMTVSPINSIDYYSNLAKEDYYLDGGEPVGKWAGKGALLLGLKGEVNNETYRNVLKGYSPNGKEKLCQLAGEKHKAGWDLTFSAPKSVSVVWARADLKLKAEIQDTHEKAVRRAIKLLEKESAFTRRGKDGNTKEKVMGLVASLFEHATSRAQDPQLHTHCLIANVAPRIDGTWGTLESKHFYQWQKAIGAGYRAELSSNMRELGFSIEADGDSFKLSDVPKSICDYYSKRSSMIEEKLKQRGGIKRASKSGDIVSLSTRVKKSEINRKELYQTWATELDTLGFPHDKLTEIRKNNRKPTLEDIFQRQATHEPLSIELLEKRLTEKLAVFKKQDVYRIASEIAQHSAEGLKVAEFYSNEFLISADTISLGMDKKQNAIYTTAAVLKLENEMIASAKRLTRCSHYGISENSVNYAIQAKHFLLTEEQQEAIWSACQSNHLSILQGSAGAGKSASMECVSTAYKFEGFEVIGASLSRAAANNLENEANINAHTIAKLLKDIENGKAALDARTVLIVDEAGQVGTRQLSKLLEAAERHGSKIILVGEDKQLQAIEHAGALKYLSNPKILGTTRIETIKRQKEEWARQAVADFRDGRVYEALKAHQDRGLLHFGKDADKTKQQLLEKWSEYRNLNPEKKWMVLAQKWNDVNELNQQIRSILQAEGTLHKNEIEVSCAMGERIFTSKFSISERVRLTKNDYRRGFTNGDLGELVEIVHFENGDKKLRIKLDRGQVISFLASEYSDENNNVFMSQAYASTVYSSQGLTVDGDTFVYHTEGMDRANTYVACSRHKDKCHVFSTKMDLTKIKESTKNLSDDIEYVSQMAKNISCEESKTLATSYQADILSNQQYFNEKLPSNHQILL
jgi:conjugative relaxase-like TrwC/TraI family protein